MSQPNLPNITPNITLTRDDAVNLVLSSIAMEEIGMSHILNAEGEKLQYVLGTLPGLTGPPATISDILAVNSSVKDMVNAITKNEYVLQQKLEAVTSIPLSVGPQGPTGPTGPSGEPQGFREYGGVFRDAREAPLPLVDGEQVYLDSVARATDLVTIVNGGVQITPGVYMISYSVSGALSAAVELFEDGVVMDSTFIVSNQGVTASNTFVYRADQIRNITMYGVSNPFSGENFVLYANIIVHRIF